MLEVANLRIRYGGVTPVDGISFRVDEGELVAIVGPNGAGKSTTLKGIAGILRPDSGDVTFRSEDITRLKPHEIVARGLTLAPEGRRVFPFMTVEENLRVGAYTRREAGAIADGMRDVYAIFSRLAERRRQVAGTLSGGEQQMLSIGRALMARPRLLLLDEPSLGLAPLVVKEIGRVIADINRTTGLAILLVEQNARLALGLATRAYVIENGRVVLEGDARTVAASPHVREAYLGGRPT